MGMVRLVLEQVVGCDLVVEVLENELMDHDKVVLAIDGALSERSN